MLAELAYEAKAEALERRALALHPAWAPQPGPQTAAYNSEADVTGYGGAAGGGKSDLALGLAINQHFRSIIFRREFPRLEALVARSKELLGKDGYNESLHRWELPTGATVRFAQMQYEKDKENYQGRPFDLYVFDEATEFTESQVRFVTAWNRSTRKGQRCRVVLTFNPPLTEGGEWVTRYFAPWLEKQHPHPAQDGELRWYAMVGGKEAERPNGEPFAIDGEMVKPKSRTFFHAGLKDNPILAETDYGSTIDALPEPLRSLLKGNFDAAKISDPWQTIPADWVRLAQKRWREMPKPDALTAVGADPARGGGDKMAIARLHRWSVASEDPNAEEPIKHSWFDEVLTWPGVAVPDGPTAAALLVGYADVPIGIDVIGIGSSVYDSAVGNGLSATPINNSAGAEGHTDKSGRLKFVNLRAASYWKLREALDPKSGENVCLPDDAELLSDLCAPRYKVMSSGIQLESKQDIIERLGRSPDKGDAVVMAWWTALYGTADLVAW